MARVTGIGGVFLKAKDPAALSAWYARHLGITLETYGGVTFLWSDEVPAGTGMTTWSTFPEDAPSFGPGSQRTMINYRVDDLDALLQELANADPPIQIDPERQAYSFGKFAWIVDPEGNRLELWQPLAD